MSDGIQNKNAATAEDVNQAPQLEILGEKIKVNWTIDQFGSLPKTEEVLTLFSTDLVRSDKLLTQWCLGLGLSHVPVGNSTLDEEWLCLIYEMVAAPTGPLEVYHQLHFQIENEYGEYMAYRGASPGLQTSNLGDVYKVNLFPRPKDWPTDKSLEIRIYLTIVFRHEIRKGARDQGQDPRWRCCGRNISKLML